MLTLLLNTVYPWIPALLQMSLAVHIVRKRFSSSFQFFLSYTLFSVIATIIRQAVMHDAKLFSLIYWSTEIIYGALALAAIGESFKKTFSRFYARYRWFRLVLPGIICFIVALAYWNAIQSRPPYPKMDAMMYSIDLGIHWLEAGILFFFIIIVKIAGARLRLREFGILLGFGVSALVTMVTDLLISEFRMKTGFLYRYGSALGYLLAVVVWLYVFFRPQPQKVRVAVDPPEIAALMRMYLDIAKGMLRGRRKT
jgi:hypothetical protein